MTNNNTEYNKQIQIK